MVIACFNTFANVVRISAFATWFMSSSLGYVFPAVFSAVVGFTE